MNLNQLWVFHVAASLESFTRAADALHLTQPGISKHIKELEKFYNITLFERLARKVVLTQAGQVLFETTRNIFSSLDETKKRIDDLAELKGGSLAIGSSVTIGTYVIPAVVRSFIQRYPGIEVALTISLSREIEEKVLDNLIEIGLIAHDTTDTRLSKREFMKDDIVLALPADHPWAERGEVALEDLTGTTLIQSGKRSGTQMFIEKRLHGKGVQPARIVDFGNTEAAKKAVEAGLGISFISRHAITRETKAGLIKAVSVAELDLRRSLYVIFRRGRYLSKAATEFANLLQDLDENGIGIT